MGAFAIFISILLGVVAIFLGLPYLIVYHGPKIIDAFRCYSDEDKMLLDMLEALDFEGWSASGYKDLHHKEGVSARYSYDKWTMRLGSGIAFEDGTRGYRLCDRIWRQCKEREAREEKLSAIVKMTQIFDRMSAKEWRP